MYDRVRQTDREVPSIIAWRERVYEREKERVRQKREREKERVRQTV